MEKTMSEVSKDTRPAEVLWKEYLGNLHFYHGTSEIVAEKIKENGLSHESKPYEIADLEFLRSTLRRLNLKSSYADEKETKVYISSSLQGACSYAIDGPEMLRVFYLAECDSIERAWILGTAQKAGVTEADFAKTKEIKEWAIKLLNAHRPVLFEISKDSLALQSALKASLGKKYSQIESLDSFMDIVRQIVNLNPNMTEEDVAKSLIMGINQTLSNMPIKQTIPPEDLTEIKGDAFYDQTEVTRRLKGIIDNCLFDMEERPPELIRAIDGYVTYSSGNYANIRFICNYYHIKESKAEEIFSRAKSYKEGLEKSKR